MTILGSHNLVAQLAQSNNLRLHDITGLKEFRRSAMHAHALGRSGDYDVAGQQGNGLRQTIDHIVQLEDQVAGIAVLLLHAVDPGFQIQVVNIRHQTLVHHSWSQRQESVHRLSHKELTTVAFLLPVAGGDILGHRIPEDIVHGLRFGHLAGDLANDTDQLNLPIDFLWNFFLVGWLSR